MAMNRVNAPRSARPAIVIAGAGSLASALAESLVQAGYAIDSILARTTRSSMQRAKTLAQKLDSQAEVIGKSVISGDIVWLCVPDASIRDVAELLARSGDWKGRVVLHSSGALSSDELASLRRRGARVASVHPMMTFVKGSSPSLKGVSFAIEGNAAATRVARRIVKDLGGHAFSISKTRKVAYHAWGVFASPLLTALLATSEQVAEAAGVPPAAAKRRMLPILRQTLENYAATGAPGAFSGPIVRGDAEVVASHLRALRGIPEARDVYISLARAALRHLPAKRRAELKKSLNGPKGSELKKMTTK